jgi:hypothetical protein
MKIEIELNKLRATEQIEAAKELLEILKDKFPLGYFGAALELVQNSPQTHNKAGLEKTSSLKELCRRANDLYGPAFCKRVFGHITDGQLANSTHYSDWLNEFKAHINIGNTPSTDKWVAENYSGKMHISSVKYELTAKEVKAICRLAYENYSKLFAINMFIELVGIPDNPNDFQFVTCKITSLADLGDWIEDSIAPSNYRADIAPQIFIKEAMNEHENKKL